MLILRSCSGSDDFKDRASALTSSAVYSSGPSEGTLSLSGRSVASGWEWLDSGANSWTEELKRTEGLACVSMSSCEGIRSRGAAATRSMIFCTGPGGEEKNRQHRRQKDVMRGSFGPGALTSVRQRRRRIFRRVGRHNTLLCT